MKTLVHSLSTAYLILTFTINSPAQVPMTPDSITMTPGYVNEVYYQFFSGDKFSSVRNGWDIAFRTMKMSSSILTNDGSNVGLWTYPNADTTGWESLDTTGISTWTPMFNDPSDWENGAFSRHATGHPDYGWGIYNTVTHFITGDSIYVIRLTDGSYKKIWIVEKDSPADSYLFRYANLDGSGFQEAVLDCNPYLGKDFIGFSLQTNLPIDFQPALDSWDILFTKYMSVQPDGTPYPVTGVLSNPGIYVKKFYPVDPGFNSWWPAPWDSTRSAIGWDWKYFDMTNFVYVVRDSMVFYVKDLAGDTYRLKFTSFAGTSTGNISFGKAKVSGVGIGDQQQKDIRIGLYPNPASDVINVSIQTFITESEGFTLTLQDLTGRIMQTESLPAGQIQTTWNISSLTPGAYFLVVASGNTQSVLHFLKQ